MASAGRPRVDSCDYLAAAVRQPSHPGQFEHSSAAAAELGECGEGGAAAGHGEGGERGGSGDQHPAAVQLLHPAPAAAGPGPGQAGDSAGPR